MLIVPDYLAFRETNSQHLVIKRAVERESLSQCRRRARVRPRRNVEDLFAIRDPDRAKQLVAACDERHALCDTRRGMHRPIRLELPQHRTIARRETVEV